METALFTEKFVAGMEASAEVLFYWMCTLWIASFIFQYISLVDIFWGIGFVIITVLARNIGFPDNRKDLVLAMVCLWGLRLAMYIAYRNLVQWQGTEDYRIKEHKREYGSNYWWVSLFTVYLTRGLLMLVIASPIINIETYDLLASDQMTNWDMIGLALWTLGFVWEVVADWQMYQFRSNPANKDKVLNTGLWALTRHPNYFGESLMWLGFFLINMNIPNGIWFAISPLAIAYQLYNLTGANITEPELTRRKPHYKRYINETNSFLPQLTKQAPRVAVTESRTGTGGQ